MDVHPSAITDAELEAAIAVAEAGRLFLKTEMQRRELPTGLGGTIVLFLLAQILGEYLQPPRQADTLDWVCQGLRWSAESLTAPRKSDSR